jgi:spermidine synthase
VAWHRRGLIPDTAWAVQDARTEIWTTDVRQVVLELGSETIDLVLLDVDNGPGYLVYQNNADLYRGAFLEQCRRISRPGSVTAVWSAAESAELAATMADVFDEVTERVIGVQLGSRAETYRLYLGLHDDRLPGTQGN